MLTVVSHRWRIFCLLLLIVVFLGACTPREEELSFETLELADYSPKYEDEEPGLGIIISADEANQLDGWASAKAIEQLRDIDYEDYFALVALLGWQPTGHEGIRIERIVRQGNTVSVYSQVGSPIGEDRVSSPYHLVKIHRTGQWDTTISFALVVEETSVASQSHHIP